jgi:hypothetical protein
VDNGPPPEDAAPDGLDCARHEHLAGRDPGRWARRAVLVVLLAFVCAALANAFGQRTSRSLASSPSVGLEVQAPASLRSGLVYQGVVTVRTTRRLALPRLILGPAWVSGTTINTISPTPAAESASGDGLTLAFDPIPAGGALVVHLESQVNPTNVSRRSQAVELRDGDVPLARVERTLTVYP